MLNIEKRKTKIVKIKKKGGIINRITERRQIPVCRDYHINVVQEGLYPDKKFLKVFSIDNLYDERIIQISYK